MHHVHLSSQSIGAADYQAHLERMRELARLREEETASKRTRDKASIHFIDPDEDSAAEHEAGADEDPSAFAEREAEAGEDEPTSGTRYA